MIIMKNKDPFCLVCRDLTIEFTLCKHSGGLSILMCNKCFDETKENWFNNEWKVMPDPGYWDVKNNMWDGTKEHADKLNKELKLKTSEASSDVLKSQTLDS